MIRSFVLADFLTLVNGLCGAGSVLAAMYFLVTAERRCGRVGVWIEHGNGKEEKIAAIGIRLKKWVSFHGIAINLSPDLSHYGGIVPCGISEHGVTSVKALGKSADMAELDKALRNSFETLFASTINSP